MQIPSSNIYPAHSSQHPNNQYDRTIIYGEPALSSSSPVFLVFNQATGTTQIVTNLPISNERNIVLIDQNNYSQYLQALTTSIQNAFPHELSSWIKALTPLENSSSKIKSLLQECIERDLDEWVKQNNYKLNYEVVKERILEAYKNQDTQLDLSNLQLSTLPPSLCTLTHLQSLR